MALTLAQADLYSTNSVYRGIVEEFFRASPIFPRLPFIEVVGNAYQYVRESTRSTAAFYDPQDTWTENTGTVAQVTVALRILGGNADVDNFLKATRANYTDVEAELIMEKVKSVKFTFLDTFYYGVNATNAKEFDGLMTLITSGQTTRENASALNISNLDIMMDSVLDGPPDIIVMPKAIRRRLNAFIRANGLYEQNRDEWGNMVSYYQGVPLYMDESLTLTETDAVAPAQTGGTNGSILALKFGAKQLFGLQNSGSIEIKKIRDELDDKDAGRWRVKWYVSLGLSTTVSCAKLTGITDAAAAA